MNDRFIRLSISLARLQKVIQRIKASGMSRIELKAGHTLVLCRLAAASEGLHFSELTERCGLDPAMISRVLAELVRSGLVENSSGRACSPTWLWVPVWASATTWACSSFVWIGASACMFLTIRGRRAFTTFCASMMATASTWPLAIHSKEDSLSGTING